MSKRTLCVIFALPFLGLIWTATPAVRLAAAGCLDQTGICNRCPSCNHYCHLSAKIEKVEKECFKIESKVICIPRVVFPWQKPKHHRGCFRCGGGGCTNCINNGARKRTVCVLVQDTYECPECKYKWSAKKCGETDGVAAQQSTAAGSSSSQTVDSNDDISIDQSVPFGFDEATQFPTPLDNDGRPDSGGGLVPTELETPSGMEEALQFPTPIRP